MAPTLRLRMRTMLRFAKDPRTEAGEFIADAEERLDALEKMRRERHGQG